MSTESPTRSLPTRSIAAVAVAAALVTGGAVVVGRSGDEASTSATTEAPRTATIETGELVVDGRLDGTVEAVSAFTVLHRLSEDESSGIVQTSATATWSDVATLDTGGSVTLAAMRSAETTTTAVSPSSQTESTTTSTADPEVSTSESTTTPTTAIADVDPPGSTGQPSPTTPVAPTTSTTACPTTTTSTADETTTTTTADGSTTTTTADDSTATTDPCPTESQPSTAPGEDPSGGDPAAPDRPSTGGSAGGGSAGVTQSPTSGSETAGGGAAGQQTEVVERVTSVAAAGSSVDQGTILYTADGRPVMAILGDLPAWRSLAAGVDDGLDVQQLESGLAALGYDADGELEVDETFDEITAAAVAQWQEGLGLEATGEIALGDVVFVPEATSVAGVAVSVGDEIRDGSAVLTLDTEQLQVEVAVPEELRTVVTQGLDVEVAGVAGVVDRLASGTGDDGVEVRAVIVPLAPLDAEAGDEVTVRVSPIVAEQTLLVPAAALVVRLDGTYAVQLVDGSFVTVVPGVESDGTVAITADGLPTGSEILVP